MTSPIIGIDLGTTNCCAAWVTPAGEVRLIPYRDGSFTMPSIFALDEQDRELVGDEAKRQAQLNPHRTVQGAKRIIGLPFDDHVVTQMREYSEFEIREGAFGEPEIVLGTRTYSCEEISARFLRAIVDVASRHLGTVVSRAVVTVPAYFHDRQRQAVHEAGRKMGLDVVRVINEPTAAALAYGARGQVSETVAVFDLGGGTFDVSLIEINDRVFEVKSTGGDLFLGGLDFDEALVQFILGEFSTRSEIDLRADPVAMQRIRDGAERAKIDLSSRTEVPLSVPYVSTDAEGQPVNIEMVLRRDEVDMLCEPLVERTFETCLQVCEDAGLTPYDVDQVILVGGQTRMPLIAQRVRDIFGRDASKMVHPDEAVAVGAALYGWSLQDGSKISLQLLDVLPMAIGIEGAEGQLHRLFERNASVPNRQVFNFTTHKDNQTDMVMRLFQGDRERAVENTLLGEFTFSGIRPGKAGGVRVEVGFDVSVEGILSLTAKDLDTGAEMHQTVRFGNR